MIESINQIAQNWFDWQFAMLWQVAVVIVIVAAVDFLIKKWVWPQVRYALWLLVLVKLVMPPTLTSSTSLTAMIPSLAEKTVKVQVSQPAETPQLVKSEEAIEPISPFASDEELPNIAATPAEAIPADAIAQPPIAVTIPASVSWKSYAFFTWLSGIAMLSAWLVMRLRSLRREHLRQPLGSKLPDGFDSLLATVADRLKLKRLPEVILTDRVSCPAVFGAFKPVLLMPADKIKNLTKEDTEHILLHELAHIKRGDLLVHAVYMSLQIAYWFNPLLWLIRKQLQNLRELCCDATVAKLLKEKTYRYRETLLETAKQLLAEPVDPGLGLMGLFEDSNWLVDRLKWLEKRTWQNRPLRIAITVVLVIVMAGCILPMAKAEKFEVPKEFVGHWKGKSNIVVNWTKQRQLAIDIEIMADGKVTGQVGDSKLKNATFQRKNKFVTDLFNHITLYMIRGRLEGAIIKAEDVNRKSIGLLLTDVIDGKIEGGFHTSGQHIGNKKTMVLSGTDMELRKVLTSDESTQSEQVTVPDTLQPPVGASKRVSYGLNKIESLMRYIQIEKNEDVSVLSGYFDEINEFCDDLQGKNGEPPAQSEWGQLSADKIEAILKQLAQIENTAEGCRELARGEHKDLFKQHSETLRTQYEELCRILHDSETKLGKVDYDPVSVLANGVTVELVGLCREPVDGAKWWRADGGGMATPSFGADTRVPPMGSVPTIYTFLAKATGGQNVSMKMKVYEGYGWSNRVAKDGTAMCFVKHSHADTPYHKDAFVKGPVMIGVAQGQWLKARGRHSSQTLHIPRSYLIGGHDQIVIQPPTADNREPDQVTHLWATATSHDYEFRIVCKLKDGSMREYQRANFEGALAVETGGLKNSTMSSFPFTFDFLTHDQVVDYELFYRKYEYASFDDVAFKPNLKTDVHPGSSAVLKSPQENRKVDFDGAAIEPSRITLPELSSSFSVTGIVVDTKGRPCGNVYVAPSGVGFRNAVRSDLMGNFILKDVKAEDKNWVAYSSARSAMGLFTISRDDHNGPLRIALRYNVAEVETRVVDAYGKGISNADINFLVGTPDGQTWTFKAHEQSQPGLYSMKIPAGEGLTVCAKVITDEAKSEFATAVRKLSGKQVFFELPYLMLAKSKSQPDFDRNITKDGRIRVGGRIVDEQNKPIRAALVEFSYDTEGHMAMSGKEAMTDKDGRWSMSIPEKYSNLMVRLLHPDYIGYHFERLAVPAREELLKETSTLIMKRGIRIQGVVTDENGKFLENALVSTGRLYSRSYGQIVEDSTTARTDAGGLFSIGGLPVGDRGIMVSGQGYAPTITTAEVAEQMDPIAITVAKGITYKGRLIDVDGNGVQGAKINVSRWNIGDDSKTLARIGRSDSHGNFSIENLPPEGVLRFNFTVKDCMGFAKEMPKDLSKTDQIVIYKKPAITGHVVDSLTGEFVQKFRVISGCRWSASEKDISWSRYYKHDVDDEQGRFSRDNHGVFLTYPFDGAFYVKIVAEGYLPEITPAVKLGQKSESFVVKLIKADPWTGIICDTKGVLANNAEVAWVGPGRKAYISDGQFDHRGFSYQAETIIRAGENGAFTLPPSRNEGLIVAVHEKGYAEIESSTFKNGSKIQLTPWAKIEGIIDSGPNAAKKIEITIYSDSSRDNEGKPEIRWLFNRFPITGQSFEKENIPAIPLSVIKSIDGNKSQPITITPKPDEKLTFEL